MPDMILWIFVVCNTTLLSFTIHTKFHDDRPISSENLSQKTDRQTEKLSTFGFKKFFQCCHDENDLSNNDLKKIKIRSFKNSYAWICINIYTVESHNLLVWNRLKFLN